MTVFLMSEPAFAGTYWCRQYINGMKYECSQNGLHLEEITGSSLSGLKKNAAEENIRPLLLLAGTTIAWILHTVSKLSAQGVHIISVSPFLSPFSSALFRISNVSMDYARTVCSLNEYFYSFGKSKTALVGINPNSAGDIAKRDAFLEFWQARGRESVSGVFWNYGNLGDCCESFFQKRKEFNSVICSSDIVAIKLSSFLKERMVSIPGDIALAAIGDTVLGGFMRPGITTVVLDCKTIGRQAVKLYMLLAKTQSLTSLSATISGTIQVRESTGFAPVPSNIPAVFPEISSVEPVDFYSDTDVKEIFHLEELISHCDPLDFDILKGIFQRAKYSSLSERLHSSENTIKYRVKRMISLAHKENRDELIALLKEYLIPENL